MATDQGICKYDGSNWTYFTTEQGLPTNEIWYLHNDSQGRIWCCNSLHPNYYIHNDSIHHIPVSVSTTIRSSDLFLYPDGIGVLQSENSWAIDSNLNIIDLNKDHIRSKFTKNIFTLLSENIIHQHPTYYDLNSNSKEIILNNTNRTFKAKYRDKLIILDVYDYDFNVYDIPNNQMVAHFDLLPSQYHLPIYSENQIILTHSEGQYLYRPDINEFNSIKIKHDYSDVTRSTVSDDLLLSGTEYHGLIVSKLYSNNNIKINRGSTSGCICEEGIFISSRDTLVHLEDLNSTPNRIPLMRYPRIIKNSNKCYGISKNTVTHTELPNRIFNVTSQFINKNSKLIYYPSTPKNLFSKVLDFIIVDDNYYSCDGTTILYSNFKGDTIYFRTNNSNSLTIFNNQIIYGTNNYLVRLNTSGDNDTLAHLPNNYIRKIRSYKSNIIVVGTNEVLLWNLEEIKTIYETNEAIKLSSIHDDLILLNHANNLTLLSISNESSQTINSKSITSNEIVDISINRRDVLITTPSYLHQEPHSIFLKHHPLDIEYTLNDTKGNGGKFSLIANSNNVKIQITDHPSLSLGQGSIQYTLAHNSEVIKQGTSTSPINLEVPYSRNLTLTLLYDSKLGLLVNPTHFELSFLPPWYKQKHIRFISVIAIMLTFFILLLWQLSHRNSVKKRQLEFNQSLSNLRIQALQSQMNPHFVFNCLGAIQNFIRTNDRFSADNYLTNFAKLIRTFLEQSSSDTISLSSEIDILNRYVQLENLRFNNSINYELIIDPNIDQTMRIPNLLIQPFVENAIQHGLFNSSNSKQLTITFDLLDEKLLIEIKDNGIGLNAASQLKPLKHKSFGIQMIKDKISIINQIGHYNISFKMKDLSPNETGTCVYLSIIQTENDSIYSR